MSSRGAAERAQVGRLGQVSLANSPIYSRNGPSTVYSRARRGQFLVLTGQLGDYYAVMMADGRNGWIAKSRVNLLEYDVVNGSAGAAQPASPQVAAANSFGAAIIQSAYKFVRVPYRWGGYSTGGTDCSGFVKAVFASNGVGLPRTAREQFTVGQTVPPEQMQAGDRVYFNMKGGAIDHTGIYVGQGYFIHSSIGRGGIGIDALAGRFARAFCGAKR
jgi:cell wall-associated NlpC family hydrolase